MVNLPKIQQVSRIEKALKNVVQQILVAPESELNHLCTNIKPMYISNPQLQIALISLSERLGSAPTIYEALVNEIAGNSDNWISKIGFKAILASNSKEAIDIETVFAFTNMSELFETDNYTQNLSLCLNIADILQEQVIF